MAIHVCGAFTRPTVDTSPNIRRSGILFLGYTKLSAAVMGRRHICNAWWICFDQYEVVKNGHYSRGGQGKLDLPIGGVVSPQAIEGLAYKTPCADMIGELRRLFKDFYCGVAYHRSHVPEIAAKHAKMREEDQSVREPRKKLQSPDAFLSIPERCLNSGWDVNDDGSFDLFDPLQGHPASTNRRKRPATDSDDGLKPLPVAVGRGCLAYHRGWRSRVETWVNMRRSGAHAMPVEERRRGKRFEKECCKRASEERE